MSELQDLTALIRANTPLIVIETQDEGRVVELFRQALSQVWRALYRWSITEGLRRIDMDREDEAEGPPDASAALQAMKLAEQRGIYLLLDFHPYLGYASSQRQLRDLVQRRHCQPHVVVLVGGKVELPPELEASAVRFNPRLPDANALLKMVREEATDYARENGGRRVEADGEAVQQIVRNLQGLSLPDARRIARQLIYDDGALSAADLPQLSKLKFELLNRSGHLHYEYDTARFADVAGASRLKRWIEQRRAVFVSGNAPPGLDPPKGMLLLGVQGCGKSMLAKATAGGFGVPLLRLDFGTLYDKFHGETEKNLRSALASAEQLAPCVLWIDEIEKGLAGGSGEGDGGVSRRVLGYLLTWMAERKGRGVHRRHRQPGQRTAAGTAAQGSLRRDLLRRPARSRYARGSAAPASDPPQAGTRGLRVTRLGRGQQRLLRRGDRTGHRRRALHRPCGTEAAGYRSADAGNPQHASAVGDHGRTGVGAARVGQRAHGAGRLSVGAT